MPLHYIESAAEDTHALTVKPFLRWAGSKSKHLSTLLNLVPKKFTHYIEPFLGSGALYFALKPQTASLSDTNSDLIETYISVRNEPRAVFTTYNSMPLDSCTYYEVRQLRNGEISPEMRSGTFIYLNRLCFNGLYRTNRSGHFNVPYGGYKNGKMPSLADLQSASMLLQGADIQCMDFEASIAIVKEENLVFLDPPYLVNNKRIFKEYGPVIFQDEDLTRLVNSLDLINSRGAYFILTFADSEGARQIFQRWNILPIAIKRNIAGFAERRVEATELIITNYLW